MTDNTKDLEPIAVKLAEGRDLDILASYEVIGKTKTSDYKILTSDKDQKGDYLYKSTVGVAIKSHVKLYILADTQEDYNNVIMSMEGEDLIKHRPSRWEGTDLTSIGTPEEVCFIDARKLDVNLADMGYNVSFI